MTYYHLFIAFLFISLFQVSTLAQPTPEQVQHHVDNAPNDSLKVVVLSDACLAVIYDRPEEVAQYADQALRILDERFDPIKDARAILQFLTFKVHAENFLNNHQTAKKYAKQVIALAKKIHDEQLLPQVTSNKSTLAEAYSNIASIYNDEEQYDSTIVYDLLALRLREEINSQKIGRSYNNLGFNYKQNGQYQKALFYYHKAVVYKKTRDIENTLGNTYFNIGNTHHLLMADDSALYYYDKALVLAKEQKDSFFMGEIFHQRGIIYSQKKEYESAKNYFLKAITFLRVTGLHNNVIITDAYQELANTYLSLNELEKAAVLLDSAQKILVQNNRAISSGMVKNHKISELLYWKKGDFVKARKYLNKSFALKDSLHKRTLDQKVYKLLTDYDDELKQQRIAALEQQQKIAKLEHKRMKRQQFFLICIAILMLIIVVILYQVNKWRSKVNQELETLNNTKDKLFGIIAHDLKNPLSAFRSITQSLSEDLFSISKEDLKYFIKQLNNSANNLFELLQNLLYWSISESGLLDFQPQQTPIQVNIQEIIGLLKNSASIKNISISNQVAPKFVAIADKKMLHTILRNLIANAIKFTPDNGQITIDANDNNKMLTISVNDTGIGMDEQTMNSLFQLTTTTSKRDEIEGKGTGLGLVLCKELVERQNGQIWVESIPNQGSTFYFTLPNS